MQPPLEQLREREREREYSQCSLFYNIQYLNYRETLIICFLNNPLSTARVHAILRTPPPPPHQKQPPPQKKKTNGTRTQKMLKNTGFALYLFVGIKIKIYVQWPRCKSHCPRHFNLLISLYRSARCNRCARQEAVGFFRERVQILKNRKGYGPLTLKLT